MEIRGTVKAEDGTEVTIHVIKDSCGDEILRAVVTGKQAKLVGRWCTCNPEKGFEGNVVYKQDGECSCGVGKHHYHRAKCGHITQVG